MSYLTVTVVAGFAGWVVFVTGRVLWRHHFAAWWWVAFGLLALSGIALGVWAGTHFEYEPNPKTRILGFPVPLAVFILEDGQWIDFVPPQAVQYGGMFADILFSIAVMLLPISIATQVVARRNAQNGPDDE